MPRPRGQGSTSAPLPLALRAVFAMQGAMDALRQAVANDERLSTHSEMEKRLLLRLGQPAVMGEVARALHCMPSNLTALVDQLETKGLLKREASPDDRRVKRLVLTEAGQTERTNLIAVMAELFVEVTGLKQADFKAILAMFDRGSSTCE